MNRLLKNNYIFIIMFIIYLFKEPIYNSFNIEVTKYSPVKCNITENKYNKLLEFNNIDYIYHSDYINTIIIYKNIYNYMNEITIRGGKDYKFNNNPVIYDNTLIGVINKVYKNYSSVRLIKNNKLKLSVKVNNEVGVLVFKNNELIIENIINTSNIKVGDIVYTSGVGSLTEDLYIGTVKSIYKKSDNLNYIIEVDYKINIKDIDYVTVIKESI